MLHLWGGGKYTLYAFSNGFEGFPPPTHFMLTPRYRQHVVLLMLFEVFSRFRVPPLGGEYAMYDIRKGF